MSGEEVTLNESETENKDESTISEDHKQLIKHLQEIVGGLDYYECIKVMEENEWNLEQAVHRIMDIPLPNNTDNISESSTSSNFNMLNSLIEQDGIRRRNISLNVNVDTRPINQRIIRREVPSHMAWYWQAVYWLWSPFRRVLQIFWQFFSIFRPETPLRIENPVQDVRMFLDKVSELMDSAESPDQHEMPPFDARPYGECINDAKSQLYFLIVYLHNEEDADSNRYLRDCICSPQFVRMIRQESALLWGCSIQRPEGQRVMRTLKQNISNTPLIGIIGLQINSTTRMALLARIEGVFEPASEIVSRIQLVLRDVEPGMIAARSDRQVRLTTQSLRQQQDRDYQESLRLDQAKESILIKQVEEERLKLEIEQQELQREQDEQKLRERLRVLLTEKLPDEPNQDANGETLLVRIKLPNFDSNCSGRLLERRFYLEDSIKLLFYYIKSHKSAPWHFQVSTNFPKLIWPVEPGYKWQEELLEPDSQICRCDSSRDPPSFRTFGQDKNTTVFVIDLDA